MVKKDKDNNDGFSRRKFLKGGAALGATAGLATVTSNNTFKESSSNIAKAIGVKQLDEIPLEMNEDFRPFNFTQFIFGRGAMDPEYSPRILSLPGMNNIVDNSRPGYTQLDWAFGRGAEITQKVMDGYRYDATPPFEQKYKFSSKEAASKAIKRACKAYGASLVGITPYDERWMFHPINQNFNDLKPKSVIVMAFEMDYLGVSTAPAVLTEGICQTIYSKMVESSLKVTYFMRSLGHKAWNPDHIIDLHVPYAVAAGLGELGRNGILVTYEYGPRVRLITVFTDFEDVVYDKPISFGCWQFCQVCKKCAQYCPSGSITLDDEPSFDVSTVSNMPGIKRFMLNSETCYEYWNSLGAGCAACIATCPYNKPDFWHHRITTALTATPLKPFLNEMDDLFGYGDIFSDQACIDFWNYEG